MEQGSGTMFQNEQGDRPVAPKGAAKRAVPLGAGKRRVPLYMHAGSYACGFARELYDRVRPGCALAMAHPGRALPRKR